MKNNSPFSRFREANKAIQTTDRDINNSFVFKSYQSTKITNNNSGQVLTAAVVNQQEKDKAYIFTNKTDELQIGSIWSVKEGKLNFLISEEVQIIKEVDWRKYIAWLCNAQFDNGLWGYFIGPEKTFVDLEIKKEAILNSKQHPVLMLPNQGGVSLEYEDKIVIKGRPWLVQEYDNISTPGITYYSLVSTTLGSSYFNEHVGDTFIVKKEEVKIPVVQEPTMSGGVKIVSADTEITVSTQDGFIQFSNDAAQIVERSSRQIIFKIPFGLTDKIEVSTKRGGAIITNTYQARGI